MELLFKLSAIGLAIGLIALYLVGVLTIIQTIGVSTNIKIDYLFIGVAIGISFSLFMIVLRIIYFLWGN